MLDILIKCVLIYFLILMIMKFMGKREIGQLSLFDFVVLLLIADIAVMGIDNNEEKFYIFVLAIIVLSIIQKLLAFISLRIPGVRSIIDGKESYIIIEGKINIKEMRKQFYNMDDLVVQLRLKNIRSISEIRFLILENNGEISVFKYSDFSKNNENDSLTITSKSKSNNAITTNSNSNTKKGETKKIYPFPIIVSGKLKKDSLKILNITEEWVMNEIKKQGYFSYKEIYYANYENNSLFIAKTYMS